MVLSKKILILEDNLLVVAKILEKLAILEQDQPYDFCTIQLSDSTQVKDFVNSNQKAQFDVILLDRDDKLNGSFHELDIERFGPEKIIAISSIPAWNDEAKKRGVKRVVEKDFFNLDAFAQKVAEEVEKMLRPERLGHFA